ncbi:hypothetical protein [Kitasatospora sp. NBC_01266]|uniref:hypothetical protein n=1 Tax=Kitasatospora sp. NBC_01266 TaxID=2903572 RepID=UPI002E361FEB|nr:hypothetical protein [Kitasatospora sp. NBC_01266]
MFIVNQVGTAVGDTATGARPLVRAQRLPEGTIHLAAAGLLRIHLVAQALAGTEDADRHRLTGEDAQQLFGVLHLDVVGPGQWARLFHSGTR